MVGIPTAVLVDNVSWSASNICGIFRIKDEENTLYDVMLFGRGYSGDVWKTDNRSGLLEHFERPDMHLADGFSNTEDAAFVSFKIAMQSIRGENYLIAFADERPSNEEIEWAFFHSDRKPEPITD